MWPRVKANGVQRSVVVGRAESRRGEGLWLKLGAAGGYADPSILGDFKSV